MLHHLILLLIKASSFLVMMLDSTKVLPINFILQLLGMTFFMKASKIKYMGTSMFGQLVLTSF